MQSSSKRELTLNQILKVERLRTKKKVFDASRDVWKETKGCQAVQQEKTKFLRFVF